MKRDRKMVRQPSCTCVLGLLLVVASAAQHAVAQSTRPSRSDGGGTSTGDNNPRHGKPSQPLPTVEQLFAKVPSFSSKDPSLRSLELAGQCWLGSEKVKFYLWWQRPGHFAFRAVDAADGTPLFAAVDGQVLVYDAADPCVVMVEKCSVNFDMEKAAGKLQFGWNISNEGTGPRRSTFKVDLHSFFAPLAGLKVEPSGEKAFELRGVDKDCLTAVRFPNGAAGSCVDFSMAKAGKPVFSVDRWIVDQPIPNDKWEIPSAADVSKQLRVKELGELTDAERFRFGSCGIASLAFRRAEKVPSARAELERNVGPIDWESATRRDEQAAAELRLLFARSNRPEENNGRINQEGR